MQVRLIILNLGSAEINLGSYACYIINIHSHGKNTPTCLFVVTLSSLQWRDHYVFYSMPIIVILLRKVILLNIFAFELAIGNKLLLRYPNGTFLTAKHNK